ncbi:MAG: hypothetical protein AB1894_09155 [Chloroflexota bacterium]
MYFYPVVFRAGLDGTHEVACFYIQFCNISPAIPVLKLMHRVICLTIFALLLAGLACGGNLQAPARSPAPSQLPVRTVPHEGRWGIYALDLKTQEMQLIYTSPREIQASALRLNGQGDRLVFAQKVEGDGDEYSEICTVRLDSSGFERLTQDRFWDLYPAWSSDGSQIAFLSLRQNDLDLYVMQADGSGLRRLYDSGGHDADVDWVGNRIVFTADSRIWVMQADGSNPAPLTLPPHAGEWGQANLPFGDYDPRLSPNDDRVVFERLEGDDSPHGSYNFFIINADGSGEKRLTDTGYAQGLASWSHAGDRLVYTVAAIHDRGQYDLYIMNADGTHQHNITPDYFPNEFLAHAAVFSGDDSRIYFIGEWWQ